MTSYSSRIRGASDRRFQTHFVLRSAAVAVLLLGMGGLAACTSAPPEHVVAAAEGWQPEPGYDWIEPSNQKAGVRWVPGARHPSLANIAAATTEGKWAADPGYRWLSDAADELRTTWQSDVAHPQFAHVRSHTVEGQWIADAGYQFTTPGQLSAVVWTPGAAHPSQEHVYAGATEASWLPASGYAFANDTPGDLTVAAAYSETPGEKFGRFLGNLVVAAVADSVARPQDGDGLIAGGLVRPLAGAVRDDRLRAAVDELQ